MTSAEGGGSERRSRQECVTAHFVLAQQLEKAMEERWAGNVDYFVRRRNESMGGQ